MDDFPEKGKDGRTRVQQWFRDRDWALIVRYLRNGGLPSSVENAVWELADGFGKCSIDYIAHDLEWDWSHIRDSSEGAIEEMAAYIRKAGF